MNVSFIFGEYSPYDGSFKQEPAKSAEDELIAACRDIEKTVPHWLSVVVMGMRHA